MKEQRLKNKYSWRRHGEAPRNGNKAKLMHRKRDVCFSSVLENEVRRSLTMDTFGNGEEAEEGEEIHA